jgi:hypothetical protein
MAQGIRFDPELIDQIRALYQAGLSSIDIGLALGISDWTAKKYCKDIMRSRSEGLALAHKLRETKYETKDGAHQHARKLAAKLLGREILPTEHVHHKDHDPMNNDPSNIEVLDAKVHLALHAIKPDSPWLNELLHVPPEKRKDHMKEYWRIWRRRPAVMARRRQYRRERAKTHGWS